MRLLYQTLFLLVSFVFFTKAQETGRSFVPSTKNASNKRTALVVGNAAYQYASPLKNPINDANAMEATLKDLGFDVKNSPMPVGAHSRKLSTNGGSIFVSFAPTNKVWLTRHITVIIQALEY